MSRRLTCLGQPFVELVNHSCSRAALDSQVADLNFMAGLPFTLQGQVKSLGQGGGFFDGVGAEHSSVDFDGYHCYSNWYRLNLDRVGSNQRGIEFRSTDTWPLLRGRISALAR